MTPGDLRITLSRRKDNGKLSVCEFDLHGILTISPRGLRKILRGLVAAILAEFKN